MPKHFLSITDLSRSEIWEVLTLSKQLKSQLKATGQSEPSLTGKNLVMLFEKPSLRTKLSFQIGMNQLGGQAIYMAPQEFGLGSREPVKDVAQVTSRMADLIMARVFSHSALVEFAENSQVPVINGLSDLEHPCQALADLLTILEIKQNLEGLKLAYVGDGNNNVPHSLALISGLLGLNFSIATPRGYEMNPQISQTAKKLADQNYGSIGETLNPLEAVEDADVVYTDTWVSMGDEGEKEERLKDFQGYQVTAELMRSAKPEAIFMHDMPAYRGYEVAEEVIDGGQSVIYHQAENRLHAQKGLMAFLMNYPPTPLSGGAQVI